MQKIQLTNKFSRMKSLTYCISRGPLNDQVLPVNLDPGYLANYKTSIEKQIRPYLKQIIDDGAEIELTVAPNGKEIIYWKVVKWTAEGYDKLITSNLI